MNWENIFVEVLQTVFFLGVGAYIKGGLEDRLDRTRSQYSVGMTSMGAKLVEHRSYMEEELIKAKVKADNAFSLAHQANVTAGKGKGRTIRLQLDPVKVRWAEKKDPSKPPPLKGNA